ncbi:sigma-54-dependent Fis family transcriptional regulator [Deferribacter autotrophicus]|uniref:Sigma-54-dependent Fis family transcriptional regulator n=1 Tax=Deferribacter autotrophicus TaxID=500465 RepID=A0A5A8F256_9BACT|nr:sigma-54 dependent transcriptional regulator [Deferribacter autotrophicus]KAA0257821.1 sigma-54-dependent Fis family transcriptional regulator [Deferribacter autotrophicus]
MKIVLIEDNKVLNSTLIRSLNDLFDIKGFYDPEIALRYIENNFVDVVISDIKLPKISGMELLKKIKKISNDTFILLITGYGTVEEAVEAIKLGASDYMLKPIDTEILKIKLKQIEDTINIKQKIHSQTDKDKIVFVSKVMEETLNFAKKVASSDSTVLISGETGTGKELITRYIHENSRRNKKPLISINCANLQETVFESELFGYKKGAFTGADKNKKGLIALANGGTLFLDEIGEVPLSIQAKLLRFIESKEFFPLGSECCETSDVRIIAATNKNLEKLIAENKFRQDLFYRINVINIKIPPLRERKEDIIPLAYYFLEKYKLLNSKIIDFTDEAKKSLLAYDYPGNVRELSNLIERAMIIETSSYITDSSIIIEKRSSNNDMKDLDEVIKEHILKVLQYTNFDKKKASEILKIDRSTLYRKLKEYKII